MDEVIFSESQTRLRREVGEFVRREIIPVAAECDARDEVPERVYEAFFETGLLHGYIPEAYGGRGHGAVDTVVLAEELSYGCLSIASALVVAILPISILLRGGTEEQKRRWLAPLAKAFSLPAIACTEGDAGSELRATQTRAVRLGDQFRISGEKAFVSNLPYAGFVVVIARTEPGTGLGSPRALSAFVVPADAPGVEAGPRWKTVGLRSLAVCSLRLNDVIVAEDCLVGREGEGLSLLNDALDLSRTMMAAYGVGAGRRAVEELFRYGTKRDDSGRKPIREQGYRFKLVDMEESIATARLLTWLAASKHDAGLKCTKEASLAKLHSGRVCGQIAGEAWAMTGGVGFPEGSVVEKFYREAPAIRLIEGPEAIQSEIVFAEMLRRGLY